MLIAKKLLFSIPFLICFYWFVFSLSPFFKDIYLIFGLDVKILINLIILAAILVFAAIFFVVFVTLAVNWKLILPIMFVGAIAPMIVFSSPLNIIFTVGIIGSFGITFFTLNNKLAKYLTFEPYNLLNPSLKSFISLILLISSFVFYFSASTEIKQNGFKIPDSLLETSLKLAPGLNEQPNSVTTQVSLPSLTNEQLKALRENPDLLKQYGLDPSAIDLVDPAKQTQTTKQTSSNPAKNILKSAVAEQLNNIITPYLGLVPILLAVMFYFTLSFFASIISIFNPLIIGGVFYILEKSNYIRFEKEMREVKKLVI